MRGRCYRAKTQRIRVAQPVYNLDVPRNVVQYGSDVSVQLVEGDQMVLSNRSSTNTGSFLIRQVRVWCMVPPPMGMLHGSVEVAWIDSAFQDKGWFMFNPCFLEGPHSEPVHKSRNQTRQWNSVSIANRLVWVRIFSILHPLLAFSV